MDLVMLVPCAKVSVDTRIEFVNVIRRWMDEYVQVPVVGAAEISPRTMISFAEVVEGRNAFVRVTADKLIYAVDLVMVVTGLSRDDSGKTLRRLSDETFPSDKLSDRNLPGKGNSRTKLVTFQHAIELVMVLPGRLAKEIRVQFASIIQRYMAGDQSLVDEIEANAESREATNELARSGLGDVPGPQAQVEDEHTQKRKALELEFLEVDIHTKRVNDQERLMDMYAALCPGGQLDEMACQRFKSNIMSLSSLGMGSYNVIVEDTLESPSGNVPFDMVRVRRCRRAVPTSDDSSGGE